MVVRTLMVILVVLAAAGCSPAFSSKRKEASNRPGSSDRPVVSGVQESEGRLRSGNRSKSEAGSSAASQPPDVSADAFSSIDEAVSAMSQAAEQRNSDRRLEASGWLALQGGAAVPALRAVLEDEQAGTASKIAACRALGRLGPPAVDTLLAQVDSDNPLVRINALDQLPHIRPPTRQIVDTLIGTLDHSDARMRQQAIRGLAVLGPTAKDATPRLQQILNAKEDETLRAEAKKALQRVDPRRTLTFE